MLKKKFVEPIDMSSSDSEPEESLLQLEDNFPIQLSRATQRIGARAGAADTDELNAMLAHSDDLKRKLADAQQLIRSLQTAVANAEQQSAVLRQCTTQL